MEHNKLYQYKDVAQQAPLSYAGKLAVKLADETGSQYDVNTPVNTTENYTAKDDVIVLSNTMDEEEPMKFSFSFKVNKAVIGTGTRLILDMPGLFKVKAEAGTLWFYFPWKDSPAWKYISASGLIDGWNTVELACDGTVLSLTINGTVHTLIDTSLQVEQTTYKGGQYKYLVLTDTAPIQTADSWEINTVFKYNKSGSASHPCWFGYSTGSDYKTPSLIWEGGSLRLYLSSTGSGWDLNTDNTGFIPEDGKTYALAAGFTGTEYYVKWKIRGAEEWAGQWTKASATKAWCSVPFYFLNLSLNSYNYYNASEIYWTETNILINGSVWFGGRGATAKTFTNNNCVKSTFKEGPVLPTIKTGTLKTYQSWLYLKDIEAVKIADDSGGDSGDAEEPKLDDDGAPVLAKDLPDGWAMWQIRKGVFRYSNGLPGKDSDGYYDNYALFTNINVEDPAYYPTDDAVVLGESMGSSSKYVLQSNGNPITLIASKIQTSDKKQEEK